jgi:integrase
MPKDSHVPAYKLHKPSGQARVIIRGRHVYLGPYGSPESREKYARLIAEQAVAPTTPAVDTAVGTLLVVQLCAAYWDFAQTYYVKDGVPSGHLHTVRRALHVLRESHGGTLVEEFGPLAFQAVQHRLVQTGNSRNYINKLCETVRRMFKWGVSREMVSAAVYQALATVPGLRKGRTEAREPEPIGPVDVAVVDATLPRLPVVVADMVRLQQITGMRPGEVCKVRPCDVDRSGDVWFYKVPKHKTEHFGRDRVVCIGPKGQDIVRPYLLRAADAYCFSPAESEDKRRAEMRARRKTKVQPSQVNRRKRRRKISDHYRKDSYLHAVVRGIELANRKRVKDAAKQGVEPVLLPHWHPNQLRHSKATEVRRRFGLEAAQVALGHAHARITEVYAERDTKLAADIARKIG